MKLGECHKRLLTNACVRAGVPIGTQTARRLQALRREGLVMFDPVIPVYFDGDWRWFYVVTDEGMEARRA